MLFQAVVIPNARNTADLMVLHYCLGLTKQDLVYKRSQPTVSCIINPWRACAARVTVVGLFVCLLVNISRLECLFVLKTLSHTQRAMKVKMISLKPLRCRDPALPTLYGNPSSAVFRYAEKCTCDSIHVRARTDPTHMHKLKEGGVWALCSLAGGID